ncbi:hypothetical protein EG834_18230, partial [bacterium]|nr:hypothetical protein [bacterium]
MKSQSSEGRKSTLKHQSSLFDPVSPLPFAGLRRALKWSSSKAREDGTRIVRLPDPGRFEEKGTTMNKADLSKQWTSRKDMASAIVEQAPLKVMMLGYSGANNTGAEALLLSDIEDVRAVLGHHTMITIPSLNPPNLRRYVKEGPTLHIEPLPTVFFATLRRLVRENDLIMLVEGSTYMDTWSSALLWAYMWTTRCAAAMGKPSLAYAVDAGELKSGFNRWLVRREASKTSMIITRAGAAAKRLHDFGVIAPLQVTADNAFNFRVDPADANLLSRIWPEAGSDVVGMALVDFFQWPVVMKPWGAKKDCYK